MGKRQDWFITACVFLFLSLASQIIHCTSQKHSENVLSLRTRTSGARQTNPKERDLIQNLPGQPPVNFRQYGGYLPVNEKADRFLYYYFVEAINANDSSPLVIWFNGGPGCSSLHGALAALGPFRVNSDGKTLFRNPYSWNNEANVLFLEGPIGVGFSYSHTPIDLAKEGEDGDKRTAEENYMFLMNWLERFPEYKKRQVYITGESYAGHYAPQLAQIILHRKNQNFINLRGVLLGNPFLNMLEGDGLYKFLVSHGLIPQGFLDNFYKKCDGSSLDDCMSAIEKIKACKKVLDEYNIYAPVCLNSTLSNKPKEGATVMENDPCVSNYLTAYLNTKEVQEAMHANTTRIPYAWISCNMKMSQAWMQPVQEADQLPILQELMGKGVRVWVYSGDVDSNIPTTSTLASLKRMNLTVEKEWRPWFNRGQVGGFTESYKENLTFATVRGAGHMVPIDKPISALIIFTSFLTNTPLPGR